MQYFHRRRRVASPRHYYCLSVALTLLLLAATMFVLYVSFLYGLVCTLYVRDASQGVCLLLLGNNVQRQRNLHYGSIVNYARKACVPLNAPTRARKTKVLGHFTVSHLENEYLWVSIAAI